MIYAVISDIHGNSPAFKYDNAVVESFFGTLKCETIYLQKIRTLSDLIRTIDQYIYWYNHHRIKLTLGGYTPVQFRLMNQQV